MDDRPTPPPRNDPHAHPRAFKPAHGAGTNRTAIAIAATAILLALGAGLWYWWQQRPVLPPMAQVPEAAPAPVAAAPAPSAAAAPAIQHPIEAATEASAPAALPPLEQADAAVQRALVDLLGAKNVGALLRSDDFVRRAVATVDNLGRTHAPPRVWPVAPMPGRFATQAAAEGEQIAPENAARYGAFVAFATSVDARRAANAYKSLYPLFQKAHQELGYPQGYFNDRLVAVIDQMLAVPQPSSPVAVKLTEVKGPIASAQPWTRYEFADPALEALPAGAKVMVRMGNDNALKLKAQLRAFRAEITRRKP